MAFCYQFQCQTSLGWMAVAFVCVPLPIFGFHLSQAGENAQNLPPVIPVDM